MEFAKWKNSCTEEECLISYLSFKCTLPVSVLSSAVAHMPGAPQPVRTHCRKKIFLKTDLETWLGSYRSVRAFELACKAAHSARQLELYYKRKQERNPCNTFKLSAMI